VFSRVGTILYLLFAGGFGELSNKCVIEQYVCVIIVSVYFTWKANYIIRVQIVFITHEVKWQHFS